MFNKIFADYKKKAPQGYSERTLLLDMYTRVLNCELYDHLKYDFFQEFEPTGYIPLHKRRPSVETNLCKTIVDDIVSLLFGNDHFPVIHCGNAGDDNNVNELLEKITREFKLQKNMLDAAFTGSIGSVIVFLKIINSKGYLEVKNTQYLTPFFDPNDPCRLIRLVEKYKVKGETLMTYGYPDIKYPNLDYWFVREWNEVSEITYKPYLDTEEPTSEIYIQHNHAFGFVPAVWIKNLSKASSKGFDEIDGMCTFKAAINTVIEIDYQLSQAGRALKYAADPLVIFKVGDAMNLQQNSTTVAGDYSGQRKIVRTASNALVVGQDDDVNLLEISGKSTDAVIEFARFLRELAIESLHGNRANADRVNAAQSGKAMENMNQALIWVTDKLRTCYGDSGLIPLVNMIIAASRRMEILIDDEPIKFPEKVPQISLKWPHWYPTTPAEKQEIANATKTLTDSGVMSKKTATKYIADDYGIVNVDEEVKEIDVDQEKMIERQQPQTKVNISA